MRSGLVQRCVDRAGIPSVLFIDGHSGSGKTTLAAELAETFADLTGSTPRIIGMDELYPGWDGLAAGSAGLSHALESGGYQRYDWVRGEFGSEVRFSEREMLIVEGCGSLTAASLAAARSRASACGRGHDASGAYGVWVECPESLRRTRALARDGDMFAPHWDRWAAQEREHFARARPQARAHEILHVA
ncbi:MAG: hypothetical protein ACTIJ6_01030 [Leucobacter sp.]